MLLYTSLSFSICNIMDHRQRSSSVVCLNEIPLALLLPFPGMPKAGFSSYLSSEFEGLVIDHCFASRHFI